MKCEGIYDRVLSAREIFTRIFAVAKLKLLVARDGIEPPTPAFSGLPTESRKWFRINGGDFTSGAYVEFV